ncbi:hypothetical protein BDV18DRAFT_132833 [Aspergillus unguis]
MASDPLQSLIAALSSQDEKPFSLPPTLLPDAVLNPELITRPDPLTAFCGFFFLSSYPTALARRLRSILDLSSALVNRPLTQAELDFHVENSSKDLAISRAGPTWAISLTAAYHLAWKRSSDELKPYFHRSPNESPVKAFFSSVQRLYHGNPALFKTALTTSVGRLALAGFGGYLVSSSIAVSYSISNMSTDPRLAGYKQELKAQNPEMVRKRRDAVKLLSAPAGMQIGKEKMEQAEAAGQDVSWKAPEPAQPTPPYRLPEYRQPDYSAPAAKTEDTDFFDDDASPIAPEMRDQGGSAWDRVRAQASQPSQSKPSPSSETNPYQSTRPVQDSTQGSAWDRIRQQKPSGSWESQQAQSSSWGSSADSTTSQSGRTRAKAEFEQMLDAERKRGESENEHVWK